MKTQRYAKDDQRGFTMIELLIGVVIVGIVASLAVPNLQQAYDKSELRAGSRELESTLSKARSMAISTKRPYGVYIDPEALTFTLFRNDDDPSTTALTNMDSTLRVDTLPDQFRYVYVDLDNNAVVFQPNGSAQVSGYGSINLGAETDNMMASFSMNITPATGRVDCYSHFYAW